MIFSKLILLVKDGNILEDSDGRLNFRRNLNPIEAKWYRLYF